MALVCRYRPNRSTPRRFGASDAARVICAAIENGATQAEIEQQAAERGCWQDTDPEKCEKAKAEAVAVATSLIEGNNTTLAVADTVLAALGYAGRAMLLLTRSIPILRPASIPLGLAVAKVGEVRSAVASRRAANDALFRQVANL